MPPKAKITRDMIIKAGITIIRTEGIDSLNVRRVAALLSCSTQPVMYHFKTVKELTYAVYEATQQQSRHQDAYRSECYSLGQDGTNLREFGIHTTREEDDT